MAESYSVKAVLSAVDSNFSSTFGKAQNATESLMNTIKGTALGAMAFKGVSMAVNALTSNVSNAVSRFDTLNQYPRVLQQMGFSADEAKASINDLSDGIQGVPTSLDEIASSAKSLTLTTGNLKKSTKLALAMNNAFLASGSSATDASRGMVQFTQMLSRGKVGMQEWNTLNETMKYGLVETAKKLGITSGSTTELYDALQDGSISFDQFTDALIECSEETGGFAEIAKTSTSGIATSMTNLKTAIVRGMANSITAIDTFLAANQLPTITQMFDMAKTKVSSAFDTINSKIETFGQTKAFAVASQYASMFFNAISTYGLPAVTILGTIGTAIWNVVSDAQTMEMIKTILNGIGIALKTTAGFMTQHQGALNMLVVNITAAVIAYKLLKKAMMIGKAASVFLTTIKATSSALSKTKTDLPTVSDGINKVGKSSSGSAKKMVAFAKAFAMIGVGVLAIGAGFYLLAQSAVAVANAGPMAVAVLAGLVGVVTALSVGMVKMLSSMSGGTKKLTAMTPALLALGASILMISAGFAVLAYSAVQIAQAGPLAAGVMLGMVVALGALLIVAKNVAPALSEGAVGFIAFGAAVILAGTGMAILTASAINLANAGPLAIACMVGMVAAVALLAVGAAALGPALTAGSIGMIAFGAAVVLVATGVLIASAALAVMAGVLPTIVTYGQQGASCIAMLGAGMLVLGAGTLVASAAFIALGASLAVAAAGLTLLVVSVVVVSAGILVFGAAMVTGAAGTAAMAVALKAVNSSMKSIASNAKSANSSLTSMRNSVDIVNSGLDAIGSKAKSAMSSLKSAFSSGASSATSSGQAIGNNFNSGLASGTAKAVATARTASNNVASAMRSAQGSAYSSGVYIGAGLANGMASQIGRVRSVAAQLAAAAEAAIRAKAQIHSPSKVTDKLGGYFGEGWVNGITGRVKDAKKAAWKLVDIPDLVPIPEVGSGFRVGIEDLNDDYIYGGNAKYTIYVPLEIDGREVGKATATYTKEEIDKQENRDNRKRGRR